MYFKRNREFWKTIENVPQPPGYPIIGNLLDLTLPPEKMFLGDRERSKKYYPTHKIVALGKCAMAIQDPEDIEIILSNSKHNEKSPIYDFLHQWLGTGLLTSRTTKWQTRRKILTPAFHFSILQEFIDIFHKETQVFLDIIEEKCTENPIIDVIPEITQLTLKSISETSMGIALDLSNKDENDYRTKIYEIGTLLTYRAPRPWLWPPLIYNLTFNGRKERKLVKILHSFSNGVIEKRKTEFAQLSYSGRKRLAMLDLLLKYRAEGASIDDEGIREEVDTFMFEGHDTTSMALCYILLLLANHPHVQDELRLEMAALLAAKPASYAGLMGLKYMERCIKEALRLYPSVPFIARVTGEEVQLKTGFRMPRGCSVHIHIFDVHRNANVFPEPEKFDPDRFLAENTQARHPFAYIPFSAGPRNCIGQRFALLELKAVLCGVLDRFILEPVDKPQDIVFISDLVLRPKGPINVKFVPRA